MTSLKKVAPKSKVASRRKFQFLFLTLGTLLGVGLCGYVYIRLREWASCPLNSAMCVHLNISGKPTVGNPVTVNVDVTSRQIASPNTTLTISLPPQIELVEGNLEWHGDLAADERIKQTITIKVMQPGEWEIDAHAFSDSGSGGYGDGDTVFILSSFDIAESSREHSPNKWYPSALQVDFPMPKVDERFESVLSFSGQPSLNQEITVVYMVTTTIPITNAQVKLGYPLKGFEVISAEFSDGADKTYSNNPLIWIGNLKRGQSVRIIVTFKITDIGQGQIYGYLTLFEPEAEATRITQTASQVADLNVNKYSGSFQILTPIPP